MIEQAKREYREAITGIEAVDRLKKQLQPREKRGRRQGHIDDSKLTAGILKVLPLLGDTFTISDLQSQLADPELNRDSISTAARRLAKEKHGLELVVPGRGRREPVYRKASA